MKQTLLRLVAIALVALISPTLRLAAQPTFTPSEESKQLKPQTLAEAHYCGLYNGLYCLVVQGANELSVVRKNDYVVLLADPNLQPLYALELPQSSHLRLLAAAQHGSSLGLVLCGDEEGGTVVYSARVDLEHMQLADGATALSMVERFTYGKKDQCKVWGSASANGEHFGVVAIVEYKADNQYSSVAMMLDTAMQTEWRKDFAMGSMDQMWVSDVGRISTLGLEYENGENHIVFNLADRQSGASYDVVAKCDPIEHLRIANVVGPHVVALGTFKPAKADDDDALCGGVVAMSFNADSAVLSHFTMRPFQNEDMNILYNLHTKKKQRSQVAEMTIPLAIAPLPYGAAIALGHNYVHSHVEANGVPTLRHHAEGMHVVVVDSMAHIRFVRNLRRNDVQKSSNNLLRIGLFAYGDDLCLVKSEHRKYPTIYDIAKAAKEYEIGDRANLVLYRIAPDGQVSKQTLEAKSKHSFVDVWHSAASDPEATILTCHGSRSRTALLKF